MSGKTPGVLLISGVRYSQPLNATHEKKFSCLSEIGKFYVVGFSQGWRLRLFQQYAHFSLLPWLPTTLLRRLFFTLGVFLFGADLCRRGMAQVIVAQSPYEGLAGVLIRWAAQAMGRRVVLVTEVHGDWEESLTLYRQVPLPGLYRLLLRRTASIVLRRSDLLRTVSPAMRDRLAQVVSGKPIFVFPAYTDVELFLADAPEAPSANGRSLILFVGMLVYLKGIHRLIEAMALVAQEHPDAHLVIIGEGNYRRELERLVARLGLSGRVSFVGEIEQSGVARYLQECRLLVLPSLSEGLGLVLLEAMACGKPVIGTNVGGIPSIVQDGVNGFLVPPDNVELLAERISHLLADGDLACRLGRQGREFVAHTFSTDRYVAAYTEILDASMGLLTGERL
jgi:glycosyltransferase involved in cell wall biosynthesis